jgi:hypothetical protein
MGNASVLHPCYFDGHRSHLDNFPNDALWRHSQRDIPGRRRPRGITLCKDLFVSGIDLFEDGGPGMSHRRNSSPLRHARSQGGMSAQIH